MSVSGENAVVLFGVVYVKQCIVCVEQLTVSCGILARAELLPGRSFLVSDGTSMLDFKYARDGLI